MTTALTALVAACGGGFRPGAAFQPDESAFFDDGVDLMEDPSRLAGQWALSYGGAFDARTSLADLVALVDVVSVQTSRDVDDYEAKRISVVVVEQLYGLTPATNLLLVSLPDSLGYPLIQRHESQISGRFVAFVRFFERDGGALGHHFHLSPASPPVLAAVNAKVAARKVEEGGED